VGELDEVLLCPHCNSDFIERREDVYNSMDLSVDEEDENSEEEYRIGPFGLEHLLMGRPNLNNSGRIDVAELARWLMGVRLEPGVQVVGNLADYGYGQSLDDILNRTFEEHKSSGPPPASKRELNRLKKLTITEEHLDSSMQCSVCHDKYLLDDKCHVLPCQHVYHQDCIIPWLNLHNTCPICRFELKTSDKEYEAKKPKSKNTGTTRKSRVPRTENVNTGTANSPRPRSIINPKKKVARKTAGNNTNKNRPKSNNSGKSKNN